MPNNINRYEVRFHLTKTETNMNKNEIINELNKIEDMLTENNLNIEVVANSCGYNEHFGEENILKETIEKQELIIEKLINIETRYLSSLEGHCCP